MARGVLFNKATVNPVNVFRPYQIDNKAKSIIVYRKILLGACKNSYLVMVLQIWNGKFEVLLMPCFFICGSQAEIAGKC